MTVSGGSLCGSPKGVDRASARTVSLLLITWIEKRIYSPNDCAGEVALPWTPISSTPEFMFKLTPSETRWISRYISQQPKFEIRTRLKYF